MRLMREPRHSYQENFEDRIPFYWRYAPLLQTAYGNPNWHVSNMVLAMCSLVPFIVGLALIFTESIWLGFLMLPALAFGIPYLLIHIYLFRFEPFGKAAFQNIRANGYRQLPSKVRRELKPLAKVIWSDSYDRELLNNWIKIIDAQPKLEETREVSPKIKALIDAKLAEIEANRIAAEIIRENNWSDPNASK